ncbi:aminopeptidase P N-terminal domain-containing protein [Candidatus Sulfidibacterium hydrothermale]|uniref:aminopeptidase P N-terminal domain-containing protein n=1 Tax=Candidatus Sulfidibacterium hydrothermale TaxID=2875962 RepID=UPI001F0B5D28|nr:aminopeptidase P N-terminal domain-containing protein [Candidatus Sulfidibacterium hydrothermale]UBM63309.1 aminopeptidase P N-terminal domain-containing protein [Candidatus Sulfidibacterium hydrothermale]
MRYQPIHNKFFTNNRKKFASQLPNDAFAVFFSNDQCPRNGDQFHPFRQNSDFFYLTGIEQEKSILLIAPNCPNPSLQEVLFVLKSSKTLEIWEGHKYTKEEAKETSGIGSIYWLEDFDAILKEVMSYHDHVYLNQNEYIKFFPDVETREIRLGNEIQKQFPLHQYHRAAPLLTRQRLIKSKEEIELIQKACEITNKAFRRILQFTKPGVYEYEVEAEITHEFIRNGATGHGYAPIVASGKSACVLHYTENDKTCHDGDLLLMDFGAEYANYTADLSRTIPVNGKFTPRQKELYNAVLRVMKEVKKLYVPGNTINTINEKTNQLMEKEMIRLGLFTEEEVKNQDDNNPLFKKYFMHGTSHFMGLDVHDVGAKHEPLQPGMVLTCEPGIYIPEEKTGIRIENDILVTEKEPVDLMADFPIEPEEIEKLMQQ